MQLETILALCISGCALLFTALSFRRTASHDTADTATQRATLSADIRYIRDSIDEIKLENKSIQKDLSELKTKVVEIDQAAKSAHKRIDDLNRKGD